MKKSLNLGPRVKYPMTVTKLTTRVGDEISRGQPVFSYSFKWVIVVQEDPDPADPNEGKVTEITEVDWIATMDGTLTKWLIREGQVIEKDMKIAEIEESCSHSVQFGGMCANCGKDMMTVTWAVNRADADRARINMIHDQTMLKVDENEANAAEQELQRRLLKARKLSLVVDLDQTIIHACIEPTIGEWQRDPSNPNYEAVKDVASFTLNDDGLRGAASGCWYYIKMRPGLREFLTKVAKLYELHVYTMGTRAYATEIAKIVDPTGELFGNRIISRDENGSLTAKTLSRLFPVDTKMVVIIDDRADVWPKNRANLIKVVPYDFFVGIGDINSSFLPKREEIAQDAKPPVSAPKAPETAPTVLATATTPDSAEQNGENGQPKTTPASGGKVSALDELVSMAGSDDPTVRKLQESEQEEFLEKQLKDRPLLQLQQQLDKEDRTSSSDEATGDSEEATSDGETQNSNHERHNILKDDDEELQHLQNHLTKLHKAFYEEYDRTLTSAQGGRLAQLRPGATKKLSITDGSADLKIVPDIGEVMPRIKSKTLKGTILVLSGLVPLGVDVLRAEISQQAMSFGARIETRITSKVTHVVASTTRTRTQKVRQATHYPHIKIVSAQWLLDSMSRWERADETKYLLDVEADERTSGTFDTPDEETPSDDDDGDDEDDTTVPSISGDEGDDVEDVEDVDDVMPEDLNGASSPIDDLKTFDWGEADGELEDFLASGSEDEEGESGEDTDSSRRSTSSRTNKSKRSRDTEDEDESGNDERPARKIARSKRSTGLKDSQSNTESGLPTPNLTGGEDGGEEEGKAMGEGGDVNGEEEEADWDDDFEKEMEKAFEEEGGEGGES